MAWAGGNLLPSYSSITEDLKALKPKKALPDRVPQVQLNDKQRLFRDIVHDYAREWHRAKYQGGEYPKALRLFSMGAPGTGKSTKTKVTMGGLVDILGGEWTDLVKQATPTGCASFQMSADATTVHQLLGLCLAPKHDLEPREVKMLEEKFKNGLCLLVIDEFSMASRTMIGIVLGRLQNAHLD